MGTTEESEVMFKVAKQLDKLTVHARKRVLDHLVKADLLTSTDNPHMQRDQAETR